MSDNPDKGDSIRFNENGDPEIEGTDKEDTEEKEDADEDRLERRAMQDFSNKFDNVIIDLDDEPQINSQTIATSGALMENSKNQETLKQNSLNFSNESQHNDK